jgi:hypothetical protein
MTKLSRALTPEEKVAKGEFILQVAERIIRDEGLEALSMNRLVQETGFARGNPVSVFHDAPRNFGLAFRANVDGMASSVGRKPNEGTQLR